MNFLELVFLSVSCLVVSSPTNVCQLNQAAIRSENTGPQKIESSADVLLTAQSALVWDVQSGKVLYAKNSDQKRPIASLSKLLSFLVIREKMGDDELVEIPSAVRDAQRSGANIRLPIGEHASVEDLLAAGVIASANDAVVSLAVAAYDSEAKFVEAANAYAARHQLHATKAANATGLSGGEQYSNAQDVRKLLTMVYEDQLLRSYLALERGSLKTIEGSERSYISTNKLLDTYVPIIAAKTGYTVEAGQNLVILTRGQQGQVIGAVILGSDERFQDMKILVEWIWRNYRWQ